MNKKRKKPLCGVSLFTGAGIGDIGFRASGIDFIATCEVEHDRASLAEINFPNARHFTQDIHTVAAPLCSHVSGELPPSDDLFLVACTAPCQGMSKNGQGKLLNNMRKGVRPKMDPRNRLILPALQIVERLRPRWVVFENVVQMRNTIIQDDAGNCRRILEIINDRLTPEYVGQAYDVEFADYGIPQRRQRLITVYTRDPVAKQHFLDGTDLIPVRTHAKVASGQLGPWVSVSKALCDFPALDAKDPGHARSEIPFHRVPVLDPKKYEWIKHTPPGASAFDNQCINPKCRYRGNTKHGASHDKHGINRAHRTTPLYCEKCGDLLPRPYTVKKNGDLRIMSGYTSAYKRMDSNLPAPALTRNLSYPCSDQKVHPSQNRVLSLAEAMKLQTIREYEFSWGPISVNRGRSTVRRDVAPDSLIRLVIGESVPPRFLDLLGHHLILLSFNASLPVKLRKDQKTVQHQLF